MPRKLNTRHMVHHKSGQGGLFTCGNSVSIVIVTLLFPVLNDFFFSLFIKSCFRFLFFAFVLGGNTELSVGFVLNFVFTKPFNVTIVARAPSNYHGMCIWELR